MKVMTAACYGTYSAILRALRAKGVRLDFYVVGLAADAALAATEGDIDRATELVRRLGLDAEDLE